MQTNLVAGIYHLRKERPKRALIYFENFGTPCDSNSDLLTKNIEGLFALGVLICKLKMKADIRLDPIPFPDVAAWVLVSTV